VGDEATSPVTSEAAIAVIAGLVFFAVLNLILLLVAAVERRRRDAALRSRMLVDSFDEPPDPVTASNPTFIPSGVSDAAERAAGSGMTAKLARRLHQAGWSIRVGEFLSIVVCAGIVAAVGGYLLLGPVGSLLGMAAAIAPFVVLSAAATKRLAAIQGQLADTLMVIASSLRAGHSFLQSLDTVTKEIGEPGASEFGRTMSEIRIGRTVDDALDSLVERVGSRDLEWAITAIKIQRRIGGNLAEILEGVANTIRERETLRRQVKVLSAEGRISAVVLTVLPIFIAVYLMRINPDYLRVLTTTRLGILLISAAAGLMLIGYIWMKRIVRIDDV
jgi:tight adherence protein B